MIEKLVKFQIKYSKFLFLFLIMIILISVNIGKELKIDPSFSALVDKESEYNTNLRILNSVYDSNNVLIVFLSVDENTVLKDVPSQLDKEIIGNYQKQLSDVLVQSSYVRGVSEPIFSDDLKKAKIMVSLYIPEKLGAISEVKKELQKIVEYSGVPFGVSVEVTGFPMVLDRVSTLLIQDNLNTIMITLIFVFLILYWYSRDFYFSIITLGTPLVSLILLAALMVILNINVTITLAAVGVLILGLGADYAIHIAVHYQKARKIFHNHEEALIHTISDLILPITASFITTLAGFVALILGVSPSSQMQGMVLALGITLIFLTTFIQFPILITVFESKIHIRENKIIKTILCFLARWAVFVTKYSKLTLWMILIITIFMFYGASQVKFSTSNSNWIPDNDPVSLSAKEHDSTFGMQESIILILNSEKSDLRDVQKMRDINRLVTMIEGIPNIDSIDNPFENIDYDTSSMIEEISRNESRKSKFNEDFTLTTINIYTYNFAQDEEGKSLLLKDLRKVVENYPVRDTKISFFGNAVRFEELGDSLQKDAGITTLVGFLLVFFVSAMLYFSLNVGFLSLVPIIIAIIWTVGLMGYLGVPFTSLSTGIISLVLGIGVDFSLHLVDGIKKKIKKMNIKKAIEETMTSSGKAIFLSSITTFIGFMALTFANLLGTQRLGYSLAISIVCVFFVTMMFIPAIMNIKSRKGNGRKV